MQTREQIEIRIALLESRQRDNRRIIQKLLRKLRRFDNKEFANS